MKHKLLYDFLAPLSEIDTYFQVYLEDAVKTQFFRRGDFLIKRDQIIDRTWFIASGLLKSRYFDQDGKQIVTRFWKENEMLIVKKRDFISGTAWSSEEIVLLEDAKLLSLSAQQISYIFEHFPQSHVLTRKIYFSNLKVQELRSKLLVLPAGQAYEAFCVHFPSQRLRLQDIAYYLNIRPYSLSRIRKRRQ